MSGALIEIFAKLRVASVMNPVRALVSITTMALLGGCDIGKSSSSTEPEPPNEVPGTPAPDGYYVHYNKVFYQDGREHRFIGVSRPSLEWAATGQFLAASDYTAMRSWGANVVRIPLNQVYWLTDRNYPNVVHQQVTWAKAAGLDVVLDLHRSDGAGARMPEQQEMADQDSLVFWNQVARRYQGDGRVLFELYNEPYGVGWDVWRDGGLSLRGDYQVAGMQQLYDTIRATGAHNLVVVGGLDYAYELSGVRIKALDGYNIVYASHPYDFASKLPADWDNAFGNLSLLHPIILTEFGITENGVSRGACDQNQYYADVINYANFTGMSWVAWAWWADSCAFPSLVTNLNGAPTAAGAVVRDLMLQSVP